MSSNSSRSVLMLGGTGSLGARATRMLRRLQPDLPITIAARDMAKADALAEEVGNATTARVDIERIDLGLPDDAGFSAVVTALRDHSLNTMRYAQSEHIPYVALSDGVFELGPTIARYAYAPTAAPILLLGHSNGGAPTLAALHFARRFRSVEAIELGLIFDPDDPFGPVSGADLERISKVGPLPLMKRGGHWRWAGSDLTSRQITGIGGVEYEAHAAGLLDVLSLGSATRVGSVRIDLAGGQTESSRRGDGPSNEVVIEITGDRLEGGNGRYRYELIDFEGYAAMSARGAAVAIERLLGLEGSPVPRPGLYLPETLIEPGHMVQRLKDFGVQVNEA